MRQWVGLGGVASLVAGLIACSGGGGNRRPDAGIQAHDSVEEAPIIQVAGTVSVHPAAAAFLGDAGVGAGGPEGLTLTLEEPFLVASGDPDGVFGSMELDASGAFRVDGVDTGVFVLGLGGRVEDGRDAGTPSVVRATTLLHDDLVAAGPPEFDIPDAQVWTLPAAFHDRLTDLVTPPTIASLTMPGQSNLIGAGFVLGQVVDAEGKPVSGVTVEVHVEDSDVSDRLFYVNGDFTTVGQVSTSSNGLFVVVGNGSDMPFLMELRIAGRDEYPVHRAVTRSGSAMIVTIAPAPAFP